MGLLYTKFYLDFDPAEWSQTSNDPVEFQATSNGISLDIEDTSQNTYRLRFRNGGKVRVMRVTGRFRITWNDDDILS